MPGFFTAGATGFLAVVVVFAAGFDAAGFALTGAAVFFAAVLWPGVLLAAGALLLLAAPFVPAGLALAGIFLAGLLVAGVLLAGLTGAGVLLAGLLAAGVLLAGLAVAGVLLAGLLADGVLLAGLLAAGVLLAGFVAVVCLTVAFAATVRLVAVLAGSLFTGLGVAARFATALEGVAASSNPKASCSTSTFLGIGSSSSNTSRTGFCLPALHRARRKPGDANPNTWYPALSSRIDLPAAARACKGASSRRMALGASLSSSSVTRKLALPAASPTTCEVRGSFQAITPEP